jgi:hypothetical protein
LIRYPWDATQYTPNATGVPPHVTLLAEMEQLRREFREMQASLKNDMTELINEQGVGGNEFHTNSILTAIQNSTREMNNVLEQINVSDGIGRNGSDEYENEGSNFVFDEDIPLLENEFDYNDDSNSVYGSSEHF